MSSINDYLPLKAFTSLVCAALIVWVVLLVLILDFDLYQVVSSKKRLEKEREKEE